MKAVKDNGPYPNPDQTEANFEELPRRDSMVLTHSPLPILSLTVLLVCYFAR